MNLVKKIDVNKVYVPLGSFEFNSFAHSPFAQQKVAIAHIVLS